MSGSNEGADELPEGPTHGEAGIGDLVALANLVAVSGALAGRVFPLLRHETQVGRSAASHIQLDEWAISSRHASILQTPEGHSIIDHGSTNGTFLNGRRLQSNQPFELSPGDSVQFAETVLTYLPAGSSNSTEHTHYLSKLVPQISTSNSFMRLPAQASDAEMLIQLLKASQAGDEQHRPKVTLEDRVAQLRRFIQLARRNWLPLFVCAAMGALAGVAAVFLNPPPSVARCTLRITPPADSKPQPYDRDGQSLFVPLQQSFMSPRLIEATLAATGAPHPNKAEVDGFRNSLDFVRTAYATYEGSYESSDPRDAVQVLAKHLEGFLTFEIAHAIQVAKSEVDFLDRQVKEREAEVRKSETELEVFKQANLVGLPEFTAEHVTSREALIKRRAELGAESAKASMELGAARKRLKEEAPIQTKLADAALPYETALVEVNRKLGEARAKGFGDQHPEIIALLKQREELEAFANKARNATVTSHEKGANAGIIALRNQVTDLDVASRAVGAELGAVSEQLTRLDGIVNRMPGIEAKYQDLSRAYAVNTELHGKLVADLHRKQLALDLERSSVAARYEVLVPPESSGVRLRRVLAMRALVGVIGGLALGAFFVAVAEIRRRLRSMGSVSQAIVVRSPRG